MIFSSCLAEDEKQCENQSLIDVSMEKPRIVIDVTPVALRKKAAKRKRKNLEVS